MQTPSTLACFGETQVPTFSAEEHKPPTRDMLSGLSLSVIMKMQGGCEADQGVKKSSYYYLLVVGLTGC